MSIVRKCMTIMSIIITEEDLCKKHAKKCGKICQFSSLPSKWFQAANDPNTKIDSKPHICAYNYNTRTGFRDHKKTWGPRVLSSALIYIHSSVPENGSINILFWICMLLWRLSICKDCLEASQHWKPNLFQQIFSDLFSVWFYPWLCWNIFSF